MVAKRDFRGLPTHTGLGLQFLFYQIDDYDHGSGIGQEDNYHGVYFRVNGRNVPYTATRNGFNLCGNDTYDAVSKIIINDTAHSNETLTFEVHANGTKFGISNMLLFLYNCVDCASNSISY